MKKLKFKAILFDMDGVIVDSMPHHAESWRKVFKTQYNLDLTTEEIFKREGMSGLTSIIDILEEKNAVVPGKNELMRLREKKMEYFERNKVEIFHETGAILDALESADIRMGLVTGSLMRSVKFLLNEKMLKQFEVIVTVDGITNGKPDPEPFLKGIEGLGMEKKDILAVENAPLGIKSAKNAGLKCYAIATSLDRSYLSDADMVFDNHSQFYEFINQSL